MKKIMISLCMIAVLFCTSLTAFADTTPTLTVGEVKASQGESVNVPITISGNPGMLGGKFSVSYDSALKLTAVSQGEDFADMWFTKPGKLTENPIGLVFDNVEPVVSNGVIVNLTFTAPAEKGIYEIKVSYENGDVIDGELKPVNFTIVNGSITVGNEVSTAATGWSGAVQWTLTSDGTLTVYGKGNMKNYGYNGGQPWLNKGVDIKNVVIEKGVTAVGTGSFRNLTTLESVILPDSGLTKIGEAAFYGCTALKEITIPEGIYTVWAYTFKNCSSLAKIKFPKTLEKIDQGAFENCTSLPYVFMPTNVKIVGSWSFKGCTGLAEVDMSWADATEVREGAFKNCSSLTTVHFPTSMQKFGDSAFYGIGAETFTVPATVTEVGPWCFARANLKEIIFEGNAPKLGEGAFNKITLTAYYPDGDSTWNTTVKLQYGGTVTWKERSSRQELN